MERQIFWNSSHHCISVSKWYARATCLIWNHSKFTSYPDFSFSRTFQDLKLQFPALSRTKLIFQDFPGPGKWKKKSRTFQEAWEPHYTQCNRTDSWKKIFTWLSEKIAATVKHEECYYTLWTMRAWCSFRSAAVRCGAKSYWRKIDIQLLPSRATPAVKYASSAVDHSVRGRRCWRAGRRTKTHFVLNWLFQYYKINSVSLWSLC